MRGVVAKRLRSFAQSVSVGHPEKKYGMKMVGKSPTGTIMLHECTRLVYKNLKKMYRARKRGIGSVRRTTTTESVSN